MKPEPPLIMLMTGRRPRARRAPQIRERELPLHMAVVDILKKLGRSDWRWTHMRSGELRDPRTAAKLKAMGTTAGWPDILLVSPTGRFCGLELKAPDGRLSDAQEDFERWAIRHAISYSVVRSIDEALIVLKHWDCIRPVR